MLHFAPHNVPAELAWFPCEWEDVDAFAKAAEGKAPAPSAGRIVGIASTDLLDADGHVVVQAGLDWTPFEKAGGPITFEHPRGAFNDLGEATSRTLVTLDGGIQATKLESLLYTASDLGRWVYNQSVAMKKSGGKRRLGYSIEGYATKRDGNRIEEAVVTSVAVSGAPKNRMAWFEPIMASMMAGGFNPFAGHTPLALGAGAVGYPRQGVEHSGEIAPAVPQSIQGKADGPRSADVDLTPEDQAALRLLRANPNLTWARARALVTQALKRAA